MYHINEETSKIVKTDIPNSGYKGIDFPTMKEASLYKRHIYKKYHDRLGVKTFSDGILEELKLIDIILGIKDKIVYEEQQIISVYEDGFTNTEEWRTRESLNSRIVDLRKDLIVFILKAKEGIQRAVLKRYGGTLKGVSPVYVSRALYNNRFDKSYDFQEVRDICKIFRDESEVVEASIESVHEEYKKLHDATAIQDDALNRHKNNLVCLLGNIKEFERQLISLNVLNIHEVNSRIEEHLLKDMFISDELRCLPDGTYNIYHLDRNSIYPISIIDTINNRAVAVRSDGILLRNNDRILIDRRDLIGGANTKGLSNEMSFNNTEER